MIQPLHVPNGVSPELRGFYTVPLVEWQKHAWGLLTAEQETEILTEWVSRRYKQ
jgi:hypothetical protein